MKSGSGKELIGRPSKKRADTATPEASTPDRILDAAERLFASQGGEAGVSMRAIADLSRVRLSLLSYHFGSKAELYRAVFERRAKHLAGAREEVLAAVLDNPDHRLEDVIDAFIRPSVEMCFSSHVQGSAFALLTAFEASDPREADRGILAAHFDPTAQRFIAALSSLQPDASHRAVVEAYLFMVGALVMTMVSGSRLLRLGGNRGDDLSLDVPQLTDSLIAFCSGGVKAALTRPTPDSS